MTHNCPTCVCDSMTEDEWRNAMNLTDERWAGVHFWFDDNLTGGQACAKCGNMRRADGKNKPCKDVLPRITTRAARAT